MIHNNPQSVCGLQSRQCCGCHHHHHRRSNWSRWKGTMVQHAARTNIYAWLMFACQLASLMSHFVAGFIHIFVVWPVPLSVIVWPAAHGQVVNKVNFANVARVQCSTSHTLSPIIRQFALTMRNRSARTNYTTRKHTLCIPLQFHNILWKTVFAVAVSQNYTNDTTM